MTSAAAANLKGAHLAPVSFVLCVFVHSLTALCRQMVQHSAQMSTAVGVLMLSVADLAVLWRVKGE